LQNEHESSTTLKQAIANAQALLATQPALAVEKLLQILHAFPNEPHALLLLGAARRNAGDVSGSIAVLTPLAKVQSSWAPAQYELGLTLAKARRPRDALAHLVRSAELRADMGFAWLAMVGILRELGDSPGAERAYANYLAVSTGNPALRTAAGALCQGRLKEAEAELRAQLLLRRDDSGVMTMLSEVLARSGRHAEAKELLTRCLETSPDSIAARHFHAVALFKEGKAAECMLDLDKLLIRDPDNPSYLLMKASSLTRIGEFAQAIDIYTRILANYPRSVDVWLAYGDALKTTGRLADSIQAYRRAIEISPALGEAYWSLANLKGYSFSSDEVAAIRQQLARSDLRDEDRLHFCFALGKELEDAAEYADSFAMYAEGNRLRRKSIDYDPDRLTAMVDRSMKVLTADFFGQRRDWGCQSDEPVFIVGLPRSGSTLIEQVLASHSKVEATMELPEIIGIARTLATRGSDGKPSVYPDFLATLSADEALRLGEDYLDATQIQRKTGRPLFIDKNPNNVWHIGLIHLILPRARIIDARRHPLATCFSCFKQHFAEGQFFAYSLGDLGKYYRDYARLLAHFDEVLPGRIHRVHYERLVEATEAEIRRLLEFCGLPFEDRCLRFYETERPINTPSAEQVRRPIFTEGMQQWRNYMPWLETLEAALSPALECD
jgi:tetratricopeptide (TPR) repeat protein